MSITAPQNAHKLVLQVAEWLTASLSGLARDEVYNYITFSTCLKINESAAMYLLLSGRKGIEPISSDPEVRYWRDEQVNMPYYMS